MAMTIPSLLVTDLSRFQFAFVAIFHFLFVPLTLGLTWTLVVMEALYLKTGKIVYRDMTQFWGKLLAINFAVGVLSGITMEFEFGLNWSYFSRMIGGSFGPILAIEGITAFMLEATMFGLFFFAWDKLSKAAHFMVTFFMALGASLSIVNILAANSWMQYPTNSTMNFQNMSVELKSLAGLYLNSLAQIRIGHVAYAGFFLSSVFIMGISAYYLLRNRDVDFAKRSFAIGASFALGTSLMVLFFGDQNGLQVQKYAPEKMAAIEGQWTTQPPPAAWLLVAFPDQAKEKNYFPVKIPYALSLIATHSLTGTVKGIKPIVENYQTRVRQGGQAYAALQRMWTGQATQADEALFKRYRADMGFGLLLDRYTTTPGRATPEQIRQAARDGIPDVATTFWAFRVMLGIWAFLTLLIVLGLIYSVRNTLTKHRFFLRVMLWSIPLPYIAAEAGWILAEVGRQPWAVHYWLPTFWGTSSLSVANVIASLSFFILFYLSLLSLELFFMQKYARKGPSTLGTGRYHFERDAQRGQL